MNRVKKLFLGEHKTWLTNKFSSMVFLQHKFADKILNTFKKDNTNVLEHIVYSVHCTTQN